MPAPDWSLLLRTPAFETTAFLMGLVVGSFANVCIHRLPRDTEPATGPFAAAIDVWRQVRSVVHPPSHCPGCGQPIRPWDNVPVLSWLALRGRCRSCRAPIAWRYPAVEAATGALWLALAVLARAERADARGDGPRERPPRPEPDRPRAPAPARRDHPPRHRARASPRASCRARRSDRSSPSSRPRGAGSRSPSSPLSGRGCGASTPWARATGRWRRCSGRSSGGRSCC